MRVTIRAYLSIGQKTIKDALCAMYPTLNPARIGINFNGVNLLEVSLYGVMGNEDHLREDLQQIVKPFVKEAPVKVAVPLREMIRRSRGGPVLSRKSKMF